MTGVVSEHQKAAEVKPYKEFSHLLQSVPQHKPVRCVADDRSGVAAIGAS